MGVKSVLPPRKWNVTFYLVEKCVYLANGLDGDREPRVDDVETLESALLKAALLVNLSNVGLATPFLGKDAKQCPSNRWFVVVLMLAISRLGYDKSKTHFKVPLSC